MIIRNNITEVAYNIQSTTDAKHYIPIDYKVTNNNDSKAMGNMLRRAKSILRTNQFTALYDKGYHTGSELKTAVDLGVEILVAIPDLGGGSKAPDEAYNVSEFVYNPKEHTYTCPQGHTLTTNGNWYKKDYKSPRRKATSITQVQHFKTPACKDCPMLKQCTTNAKGKLIQRSEYQSYVDINKQNILQKEHLYKRRQAIIEHNYGTIKRQWNFHYILTKKGKERAGADVGFMFVAYNLRRILNLIDTKVLKEYLRILCLYILTKFGAFKPFLRNYKPKFLLNQLYSFFLNPIIKPLNSLYLNPKLNVSLSF
jgi:radical SAM protein with 4Fe4S-binding SPASM domain